MTRRCSERRFFLRPSPLTNDIFLYVLAVATQRYGVLVHAFCVLSNHYHLLVTDVGARLPAFMQFLNSQVARATNALLGRFEGFWASGTSYSAVAHADVDDVVRKLAYVLANPVAAGLVRSGREWPGLYTGPEQLGAASLTAPRPRIFFREKGDMPASATLHLTLPPGFTRAQDLRERVTATLHDLEDGVRRRMESERRTVVGRDRVLAQRPFARPPPGEARWKLNPRVAAADAWKRIEALSRLKQFLRAYRTAWTALRAGARDVVFPAGTYRVRIQLGVRCAAPA